MPVVEDQVVQGDLDAARRALATGHVVVLCDDAVSAVGGVLCCSAVRVNAATINFFIKEARGLVCVAMMEARLQSLGVPVMEVGEPLSCRPSFAASIEASSGVTTGISAADRAHTIRVATAAEASSDDIVMPGHVLPIQVRSGGVLLRAGLAEAAVDLVAMTGDEPAAALCMVLDDRGEIGGSAWLTMLAEQRSLAVVTIQDVVAERLRTERVVRRIAEREISSGVGGAFRAIVYRSDLDGEEHMALVVGDLRGPAPVTVRVHSQCLTGDVFASTRCDCGDQLVLALERIGQEGRGAVIYMHQEGRGIGLANKIRAYALQDRGRDTVEANLELGFKEDLRDYTITSQIIRDLGIQRVRLLTNNPQKVAGLERYQIEVAERESLEAAPHEGNIGYLRTKRTKLGHLLDPRRLGDEDGSK